MAHSKPKQIREYSWSRYIELTYVKNNKNVGNKFRLVTAMHRNGPLPQVTNYTFSKI